MWERNSINGLLAGLEANFFHSEIDSRATPYALFSGFQSALCGVSVLDLYIQFRFYARDYFVALFYSFIK